MEGGREREGSRLPEGEKLVTEEGELLWDGGVGVTVSPREALGEGEDDSMLVGVSQAAVNVSDTVNVGVGVRERVGVSLGEDMEEGVSEDACESERSEDGEAEKVSRVTPHAREPLEKGETEILPERVAAVVGEGFCGAVRVVLEVGEGDRVPPMRGGVCVGGEDKVGEEEGDGPRGVGDAVVHGEEVELNEKSEV